MSRRNSTSRRRNYGRRLHEVRERRPVHVEPFDARVAVASVERAIESEISERETAA